MKVENSAGRMRQLSSPSAPTHPLRSPELRLLLARIDEAATDREGHYDTVLATELARLAGRGGLADRYLSSDADPDLRAVFGSGGALSVILGAWQPDGAFRPGLANLSEQECRAYELSLAGFDAYEIAQFMDRKKRSRQFGTASLHLTTVDKYLCSARGKLRILFARTSAPDLEGHPGGDQHREAEGQPDGPGVPFH